MFVKHVLLMLSVRAFGAQQPIVISLLNTILVSNHQKYASKEWEVYVVVVFTEVILLMFVGMVCIVMDRQLRDKLENVFCLLEKHAIQLVNAEQGFVLRGSVFMVMVGPAILVMIITNMQTFTVLLGNAVM